VLLSWPAMLAYPTVLMHSLVCGPRLPHVPVLEDACSERCRSGACSMAQNRTCL
jgi:hypothetical protein